MSSVNPLTTSAKTDWNKCCLCQIIKKGEDLKSPPTHYTCNNENDGYSMIATNVPLFQSLNQLPIMIDLSRLDEGIGIENTLRKNQAKYHQSCRLLFSNSKLDRARKRAAGHHDDPQAGPSKRSRTSLDTKLCFLCENVEPSNELRKAMTMQLNDRINECARNLNDGKLLAILSAGDVVAQELKYHCSCLTALYNRERAHASAVNQRDNISPEQQALPMVFSELLTYIIEMRNVMDEPVVFRLADLVSLYKQRLQQFGPEIPSVNSTRLKDRLLAEIPELEAYKSGRDVLLAFKKDIGPVLSDASGYSDAIILAKAAKILRKQMTDHKSKFDGIWCNTSLDDSIPPALLQFVCMIEHGADIKSQLTYGATTTDLAVAQLLQYNCFSKHKEDAATYRHSKDRETPFPMYIGLSVYAKTRKRNLVEMLHDHGLSISYDRVLEISAQLGDAVVSRFIEEGVVCPSVLRRGIFCTAAMDNIDHNPSSTSATSSFHGTSISIFQHPTQDNHGHMREPVQIRNDKVKKVSELPDSYTNVRPAFLPKKNPLPAKGRAIRFSSLPTLDLTPEYEWLEEVRLTFNNDDKVNLTWSAHHAAQTRGLDFQISVASLLPLLRDEAHSFSTVRHVMDKVREIVSYLNRDQTPVITADQPIYAVAKQVQWQWPDEYGEDKFVIMFGGLHIEMTAFKSLGTLLKNSGWTNTLVEAGIVSSGTAESFLSASSLTRTRQIHQVTAVCLYILQKTAFQCYCNDESTSTLALNFDGWCDKRRGESPQFQFWELVLSMQLTVFSLVRSFREANFDLYCDSLSALIPLLFANNNVNYARWLPIHLRDMISLEQTHPEIFAEFKKGNFVVHKTGRNFSGLAIDQAHEQANAVVKGDGGAVGITEDPSALRRWMIAGPEVSHLVTQYELASQSKAASEDIRHHEQTSKSQVSFSEKVYKLLSTIEELGNPFQEESRDLFSMDTKDIAHPKAAELIESHLEKGKSTFKNFIDDLAVEDGISFYKPIKKNNTDFFQQKVDSTTSDPKKQILKDDCRLFSQLFISCQSRECDLLEFFKHENQSFPAALSDNGKIHSGQKSQLANILDNYVTPVDSAPDCDAVILDGSAMIYMMAPRTSRTFEEYAANEVIPKVQAVASRYQRTDIVFDVYLASSLKAETREKRGTSSRRRVTNKTKIPPNWKCFMRDSANKTELFNYLADEIVTKSSNSLIIVSRGEGVVCNQDCNLEDLTPCNHEEADTRIFLHARHIAEQQNKSVMIKACDTDILILAVSVFSSLQASGIEELWIEFGLGHCVKWLPIHDMATSLGPVKSSGILFFHAFTGCDTVSSFRGKGKKTAWQTWDVYPEVSRIFTKLSRYPTVIDDEDLAVLERFVNLMYDRNSTAGSVDEGRLELFARKQRSYDAIPPTKASLLQHVRRATYQAACIWSQATNCQMPVESPEKWGWQKEGDTWLVLWSKLAPIAESCQQLTKCGCKTECRGRCKCYRYSLKCTALCSCSCEN